MRVGIRFCRTAPARLRHYTRLQIIILTTFFKKKYTAHVPQTIRSSQFGKESSAVLHSAVGSFICDPSPTRKQ